MCERRIAAHLLHCNDELPRLDHATGIDRRALMLHRRRGLARDGGLRHRRIAAQDAPVDRNLLTRVDGDDIAGAHLVDRHLALDLAVRRLLNKPHIALPE